jgi:AcrR family transcriptional regulator
MKSRKTPPTAQRSRRSNAERSATTRSRLIAACIECLIKVGHAATTTTLVLKTAHVSRGAMLHHFPSRSTLLLATAEDIEERQNDYRQSRLRPLSGTERLFEASNVTWELLGQPEAAALLEIVIATMSDRELRKCFGPFLKRRAELRREQATQIAEDLGVDDESKVHDLVRLHVACLWGLSIELMFSHDREEVERARVLYTRLERALGKRLIDSARSSPNASS